MSTEAAAPEFAKKSKNVSAKLGQKVISPRKLSQSGGGKLQQQTQTPRERRTYLRKQVQTVINGERKLLFPVTVL